MKATLCAVLLTLATLPALAQKPLKIFLIDVEGGQSTLFVTPTGKSLLIDTGWPENDGRDAGRIVAAAHQAHLSRIDYVLITHYHTDHVGGVPQLLARIPVGTFLDHGPNREPDSKNTQAGYALYQQALATGKYKHITLHAGDTLPIDGLDLKVISSDGDTIPSTGQPNPFCATSEVRKPDISENARSLGVLLTFGKLSILDLGDLTWDKEMQFVCPNNPLGHIDLQIVSHHGFYQSSSPALVHAIAPRVAIMDNGAKKGGSTPTLKTYQSSPNLETLWQIHYSEEGGPENNRDEKYIANLSGPDTGNGIVVQAKRDGSFTVTNSRTHFTQTYPAKP